MPIYYMQLLIYTLQGYYTGAFLTVLTVLTTFVTAITNRIPN